MWCSIWMTSSSWFFLSGSTATHSYGCNSLRASAVERTKHISVRELKATFFALKSFPKKQSHKTFCLSIGNTTAVSYVKNKGGPRSTCLVELTLELRNWCLERNILVTAQHVPGKLNTVADSESRVLNDSREWKVDLFAS